MTKKDILVKGVVKGLGCTVKPRLEVDMRKLRVADHREDFLRVCLDSGFVDDYTSISFVCKDGRMNVYKTAYDDIVVTTCNKRGALAA